MLLAVLLSVFALSLYGIRFNLKGFNEDYLAKNSTNSIKGIFILLIVISHSVQYIRHCDYSFAGLGDVRFESFFYYLSQLVVVMFLFYSGYGVSESYKNKGRSYVKTIPRHRILGTLLNFDVAVIVFIILAVLLSNPISLKQAMLSLTGWSNVGNSNWYIFVILLCYLTTYIVLLLPLKKLFHKVLLLFGSCAASVFLLSLFKQSYWYNTLLCYPLGFMYSSYKDKINAWLKKSYWVSLVGVILVFLVAYNCLKGRPISFNAASMLFALMVVIFTFKVRIKNSVLVWFGVHLFPVYIYMRIPMIAVSHQVPQFVGTYPALFIIISFVVTVIIAHYYKYWEIRL